MRGRGLALFASYPSFQAWCVCVFGGGGGGGGGVDEAQRLT